MTRVFLLVITVEEFRWDASRENISTIELVFTRLHAGGNLIKITIVVIIFQVVFMVLGFL